MQILLGIVLLIGAGLFLYARLKGVGQTSEDLQGSASGHKPGGGPRPYSQEMRSVIASIDDPIVGAAVMMAAIANAREPVDAATATVIKDELREATGVNPDSAVDFALRAIVQAPDPDNVSLRLSRMWNNSLDLSERQQLLDMATRVASMKGEPTIVQTGAVQRLKSRLDLT